MKHLLTFFLFSAMLIIAGCDSRSCKNVQCRTNEICANGGCFCNDGYYGENCDQRSADKFANKSYFVSEYCQAGSGAGSGYYAHIYEGFTAGTITINNFLGYGYQITAYLKGDANKTGNYIYIPEQPIGGSGSVQGEGYFEPAVNRITFNINYTFNLQSNSCTQTFQRQ